MNKIVVLVLVCSVLPPCYYAQSFSPSAFVADALPGFTSEFKTNNEILHQEAPVDSLLTSYNNNQFNSDDHVSLLQADHLPINAFNGEGLNEGRILNGKSVTFGDKHLLNGLFRDDACSVEKYALESEGMLKYNQHIGKLDQFTLCTWMRFTKHDGDHVMFTYGVDDEPREIQFWVANVNRSSFISLAVHGQSLYRLNYPMFMKKWHHACTSWNGKTGEWQLWIKSERVGRGFHNRLVGYNIQEGGSAYSGGPSITGKIADGLHMEITWLQLYKVALSAGKAHRDHKHHHVHQFDFNGPIETTRAPVTAKPIVNQPVNPLLANGQIRNPNRLNLASPPPPPLEGVPSQVIGGAVPQNQGVMTTNFFRGQFDPQGRFLQEQFFGLNKQISGAASRSSFLPRQLSDKNAIQFPAIPSDDDVLSPQPSPPPQPAIQSFQIPNPTNLPPQLQPFTASYAGFGNNPANVQIIDDTLSASPTRSLFKRDQENVEKKVAKRDLVMLSDGSVVDDKIFDSKWYDGIAQFGNNDFKKALSIKRDNLEDEIKEHDREPAEGEVTAVMSYCSKCLIEPFQTALVLGWKEVGITSNHALRGKTSTVCGDF